MHQLSTSQHHDHSTQITNLQRIVQDCLLAFSKIAADFGGFWTLAHEAIQAVAGLLQRDHGNGEVFVPFAMVELDPFRKLREFWTR